MIKFANVTKKEGKKVVLDNFTFEVGQGEIMGILGKGSSGKTLILDMIVGLKTPNTGEITLEGENIFEDIFKTRRQIGYMSETPVYKGMTVEDYLKFIGKVRKEKNLDKVVKKYLKFFELQDIKNRLVENISSSETKILGIIGAYLGEPKIILLDEPFVGLDVNDQDKVINFIQSNKKEYTTVIATNSDTSLEKLCDKVIMIEKGKMLANIDMKDVKGKALKDIFIEKLEEGKKK